MNTSTSADSSKPRAASHRFHSSRAGQYGILAVVLAGAGALAIVDEVGKGEFRRPMARGSVTFSADLNLVPDEKAMYTLSHVGGIQAADVVKRIVARDDKRFIPVLIEMLDANGTSPIIVGAGAHRHIFALRELVDEPRLDVQEIDSLPGQWQVWYVNSKITPPQGFTVWKGKLLGRLDPRFLDFFKSDSPAKIPVAEIRYGGAKVDGIPSLDHPRMISADKAEYLNAGEPVFGIEIEGDARAYPLRILDWHEIVNDDIGGVPVALAYCTLSDAGIAYDRRASDGKTYSFGTSGLVYHSNRLMYDHETQTLWSQFTGRPVLGPLAASDTSLKLLPLVITTWDSWRQDHPKTTVLDIKTGYERRYTPGAAYGDYFASEDLRFADVAVDKRLPLKTRVFGVRQEGASAAFPLLRIVAKRVVNDAVGRTPVVLVAAEGTMTVSGITRDERGRKVQNFQYDAGGPVRAYERGEQEFHPGSNPDSVVDGQEQAWSVTEEALVGPNGQKLRRINGFQSWWFAWSQFNPDTLVRDVPE